MIKQILGWGSMQKIILPRKSTKWRQGQRIFNSRLMEFQETERRVYGCFSTFSQHATAFGCWPSFAMNISLRLLKLCAKVSCDFEKKNLRKTEIFIPSELHLREDVAGATFMAMATSSPELFINCWGTFITEGDIGVGAIVGSAVFNILAVPACCGLFTRAGIQLDWWSVSRDCTCYGFSVIALIATIYDNVIMWYEAAFLVFSYGIYLISN